MLLEGTELSHHLKPGTLRACSVRRRNYPTTSIRALSADAPWGDGATPSSVQTAFWNCYLLLIFCLNDFFIAPCNMARWQVCSLQNGIQLVHSTEWLAKVISYKMTFEIGPIWAVRPAISMGIVTTLILHIKSYENILGNALASSSVEVTSFFLK